VTLSKPAHGTNIAVLKRVAVPDKEALASMRTEVETMVRWELHYPPLLWIGPDSDVPQKRLKGHRHIVTYIDSHASHLKGGGYEVFLLMEYCSGAPPPILRAAGRAPYSSSSQFAQAAV
jgi:AP2-associated kinase